MKFSFIVRGVGVAVLLIVWAVFSHIYTVKNNPSPVDLAIGISPILVFFLVVVWSAGGIRWFLLGLFSSISALIFIFLKHDHSVSIIYFTQNVLTNLGLGFFFLQSLSKSKTPIVTSFAIIAHNGKISSAVRSYTKHVTLAWSIFFFFNVAVSCALYFFYSVETWSVFANLLSAPLVLFMFMAEFGVRKLLLPEDKKTIMDTILAYRQSLQK